MKNKCYLFLAAVLASGAVFAQSPASHAGAADFQLVSARVHAPMQLAAARGLRNFAAHFANDAGKLPQGFPLDVRDLGQLRHARIGWGFQVYDVTGAALRAGATLETGARPTGIWRYEVMLHGRPIGLLTLARAAHGWQVVSVGGAGLVEDIDAVVAAYGGSADTQLRYVRVPQATADFIQIKHAATAAQYAPLQAARRALRQAPATGMTRLQAAGTSRAGLLDGDELRAQLRQVVARSVAH